MPAGERRPVLRLVGKHYMLSPGEKVSTAAAWAGEMVVVGFAVSGEIVNSGLRLANIGRGVERQVRRKLVGASAEVAKKPVRWALRMDTGEQMVERLIRAEPDNYLKQAAAVVKKMNEGESGLIPSARNELRSALLCAEKLDTLDLETAPDKMTSIAPHLEATRLQTSYLLRIMMTGLAGRIAAGKEPLDENTRPLYKDLLRDNMDDGDTFRSIGLRPDHAELLSGEFPDYATPERRIEL